MATTYKEGDRVQIVDREATADDVKSSLFYNHYRGLIGTVQKVYASDEVAVEIELDSMPEAVSARHLDTQEAMKSKWLDGLSEEARNRLTDAEKNFRLHYSILVAPKDLKAPSPRAVPAADKPTNAVAAPPKASLPAATVEEPPRRKTAAEIEADEEAYLRSRKSEG